MEGKVLAHSWAAGLTREGVGPHSRVKGEEYNHLEDVVNMIPKKGQLFLR